MTQFPEHLLRRYQSIEALPTEGGQARIYRCYLNGSRSAHVVKVYRDTSEHVEVSGLGPVLTAWRAADSPSNLVKLIEFGESERIDFQGDSTYEWYEIQEYMPVGTLRKYVDRLRKNGALDEQPERERFATHLAQEFLRVMSFVKRDMSSPPHEGPPRPIIHCDLKPQNVFVRAVPDGAPLKPQIVLGDFGSAREAIMSSQRTSGASHTPQYASPEILLDTSRISEPRDYWAIGVILYEVACGERPYHQAQDLLGAIRSRAPLFDAVQDDRLRLVLRGLLHRAESHRWGLEEIEKWAAGEHVDVFPDRESQSTGHRVSTGFSFLGETAFSVSDLVRLMNLQWRVAYADYLSPAGIRVLDLHQWLREEAHELVAIDILNSSTPGEPGDDVWCDRALARLGTNYRPGNPVFRQDSPNDGFLNEPGLLEKARAGAGTEPAGLAARRWLDALRASRVLDIWSGGAESGPWMSRVAYDWDSAMRFLDRRGVSQPDINSIVLMALLDPDYRASLRERAEESARDDLAQQQRWFRQLSEMDPSQSGGVGRDVALILGRADAREQTTFEDRSSRRANRIFSGTRSASAPLIDRLEIEPGRAPTHTSFVVHWRVSNARNVHIEGFGPVHSSGSRAFHPHTSGQLRLVAISRSGIERTRTAGYIVERAPRVHTFRVDPHAQIAGAAVTISWSVPQAETVEIVGVGTGGPTGRLRHFPQHDREYVLVATNSAGRVMTTSQPVRVFASAPFESQLIELPTFATPVDLPNNFVLNAAELLVPSQRDLREVVRASAQPDSQSIEQLPKFPTLLGVSRFDRLPAPEGVSVPPLRLHAPLAGLPLLPRLRFETPGVKGRRPSKRRRSRHAETRR